MEPYVKEFKADLMLVDESRHRLAVITHADDRVPRLVVKTFGRKEENSWNGDYSDSNVAWLSIEQVATLQEHLTNWLMDHDRRINPRDRRKGSR